MEETAATQPKLLKPLDNRVLIKRVDPEEKTAGGIIVPDTAKEKPKEGIAMRVGPGKLLEDGTRAPMTVAVGDRVLFHPISKEAKISGEPYVIAKEDEILGVFE